MHIYIYLLDIRYFNCNYNLIYSIFFRWLPQFLRWAALRIWEQPTLVTIICFKTFIGILLITFSRYSVCQLPWKVDNSTFSTLIFPKNAFRFGVAEKYYRNKNYYRREQTTLNFSTQICPKMTWELEIQKSNVGVRIRILEILIALIFRQNRQLWLFQPKFAQKWNYDWRFRKIRSE